MGQIAISFAVNHKDYLIGAAIGYGLSNIRLAVRAVFHFVDGFPVAHALIVKFAPAEKQAADAVADELKADIDAAVAKDAEPKP